MKTRGALKLGDDDDCNPKEEVGKGILAIVCLQYRNGRCTNWQSNHLCFILSLCILCDLKFSQHNIEKFEGNFECKLFSRLHYEYDYDQGKLKIRSIILQKVM